MIESERKNKERPHYDYHSISLTVERLSRLIGHPISIGAARMKYLDIESLAMLDIACLLHAAKMGYVNRIASRKVVLRNAIAAVIDETVAELYEKGWTPEEVEKQKRRMIGGKHNYYVKAMKLRVAEAEMMRQYQAAYADRIALEPMKPEREIKEELYEPAADGIPDWCNFDSIVDKFHEIDFIGENAGWNKYIVAETEKNNGKKTTT